MKTIAALAVIASLFASGTFDTGADAKSKFRIRDRHHDNDRLSCNTARHKVRELGFKTVKIKSCVTPVYSFFAVKNGRTYIFYVDPRTGFITRG